MAPVFGLTLRKKSESFASTRAIDTKAMTVSSADIQPIMPMVR